MNKILYILLALFFANTLHAQQLKVISYNIHHGANKEEQLTLDEMGEFIKSTGADLVGLQEVDSVCNRSANVDQMKRLGEITGMHYAFVRHFAYDGGAYGLGILSRYPLSEIQNDRLTSKGAEGEKKTLALLSAKVMLPNKREVKMASVHFALDQATRMIQSEETINYLKEDLPVILTGDLNAEPENEAVLNLKNHFTSTLPVESYTFPVDPATKTIDYIMVSNKHLKRIVATEVYTEIDHSDHLPLSSTLEIVSH